MLLQADLVEPAFKYYLLAEATGKYLALIVIISGTIGLGLTQNTSRAMRYRGMIVGGTAAFLGLTGLAAFHELVVFIMDGTAFLPPDWSSGGTSRSSLLPLAQGIAGMLQYLGLACVSLGAGFWAMSSPQSRTWKRGYWGITWGTAMICVSMGGHLFTILAFVFR